MQYSGKVSFIASLSVLLCSPTLRAEEPFSLAGKVFNIHVGTSSGGGYDLYARGLARHIGKHLQGTPTVVVKNMPGAGSIVLANYIYSVAPRDGTEIAAFEHGAAFAPALTGMDVKFDAPKFGWLGSLDSFVPIVLAWHTSNAKSVDDLRVQALTVGASGAGSSTAGYPYAIDALLGLKMKVVNGYPGNAEMTFAVEKGEIDGIASWCWDCLKMAKPTWLEQKKVRILLQLSISGDPELTAMGVPTAIDLARTERERRLLSIIFASAEFGRPFSAPPGTSDTVLKSLQKAFSDTAQDPEFIADMARQKSIIRYSKPEALSRLLEAAYSLDEMTRQELREIYTGKR